MRAQTEARIIINSVECRQSVSWQQQVLDMTEHVYTHCTVQYCTVHHNVKDMLCTTLLQITLITIIRILTVWIYRDGDFWGIGKYHENISNSNNENISTSNYENVSN